MEGKVFSWWSSRKREILEVWMEAVPLIPRALLISILVTLGIFLGVEVITALISLFGGDFEGFSNLFTPEYVKTVIFTFSLMFIYVYLVTISRELKRLRMKAGEFKYSKCGHVQLVPYSPPLNTPHKAGFKVKNNTGGTIKDVQVELVYLQSDKLKVVEENNLLVLGWIEGDELAWKKIDILDGEIALVALESWERQTGVVLKAPRRDGQTPDWGDNSGIEAGGKRGLPIYEKKYYRADFRVTFEIHGKSIISPTLSYKLDYNGSEIRIIRIKND